MALLNNARISYLGFGFEPLDDLGEITSMPPSIERLSRSIHKHIFGGIKVGGKKDYHAKFRSDEMLAFLALFLLFPEMVCCPRHMTAILHVANISLRQLAIAKFNSVLGHRESATNNKVTTNEENRL